MIEPRKEPFWFLALPLVIAVVMYGIAYVFATVFFK